MKGLLQLLLLLAAASFGAAGRDFYKILGVARDADDKTIKSAFRRKSRELHPDKVSGEHRAAAPLLLLRPRAAADARRPSIPAAPRCAL